MESSKFIQYAILFNDIGERGDYGYFGAVGEKGDATHSGKYIL